MIVALVSFSVLTWPHILNMLVFMLMGAGPDSLSSVRTHITVASLDHNVQVHKGFTFLIKRV